MNSDRHIVFSKRLKQLRLAAHLTQTKLAKEINVSRSCLANYETGKRFPDADILSIISDFFKVSVDYLITGNPSSLLRREYNNDITELLKEVSISGKLDISNISPLSKIALFEFYHFLEEQEQYQLNRECAQ